MMEWKTESGHDQENQELDLLKKQIKYINLWQCNDKKDRT